MKAEKQEMRMRVIAEIDALPEAYIDESNIGIYEQLRALPQFQSAKTIFSYYSLGREPDTTKIMSLALSMGKTVTLPVCFKGGVMEARAIDDLNELQETKIHLMEPLSSTRVVSPEAIDFIIVPALTFCPEGYRLGRGGGYYDRFLCQLAGFTVGVTREKLLRDDIPCEAHDIPVSCIVTEKSVRFLK